MVKELDLEAGKKTYKNQISNFVFLSYGHFPARNESKSTIKTKKFRKSQQGHQGDWLDLLTFSDI